MIGIRIATTLVLLLTPLVVLSFYRRRPDSDAALVRRRRLGLLAATAGAVGIYGLLLLGRSEGWFGFWREIPYAFRWSEHPDELGWILSFWLWWPFAIRLLLALRPEAAAPQPRGPVRAASLTPRRERVHRGFWIVGWSLVAAAAITISFRALEGHTPAATNSWLGVLAFLFGAVVPLSVTPFALRFAAAEPEPRDPSNSPEIEEAYRRFRRLRLNGFAAMATTMAGMFAAIAAAAAWLPDSSALGVVGGIGGSLVGMAGGAFGIKAGHERMRIRRRLDELTAGKSGLS